MTGLPGSPDPIAAAEHGDEIPGVVGPAGLTPDLEAGLTTGETHAIERAAEETIEAPMTAHDVRRLAVRGVGAVVVRTIGLRMLTFGGNIVLARILAPESFGLFAIVNFIVLIASFLAEMGMGAALVQRKERLAEADLRAAFTLGAIVNTSATVLLVALAGPLVNLYHLVEPQYARAVQMMAGTLLLSTFAIVPRIRLERELRFKQMANAEVAAQIVYISTAVALAASGLHLLAFVVASIASRTLHTVLVNAMVRWRPRFAWETARVKGILSFGIPYQLNGLVIQLKDNFVPVFIAFVHGPRAVGLINWAVGLATNALFLQAIVSRVTFPTYARLQHDLPALKEAVEKSIKWISATVFPVTFILMALAQQIVRFLYGPKWAPGLPSFYMLCIPILAASYSSVLVSALHGVGRAKAVLRLTTIWAIAGWALAVPLTLAIGFNGFALAMVFVSGLSLLSVVEMNKVVKVSFVREQVKLAAIAGLPALIVWILSYRVVHGVPSLVGLAGLGLLGYVGLLALTGEIREARVVLRGALRSA